MANLNPLNCVQTNLHYSKAASNVLLKSLVARNSCRALVQEPWVNRSRFQGLHHHARYSTPHESPRAAILLANVLHQKTIKLNKSKQAVHVGTFCTTLWPVIHAMRSIKYQKKLTVSHPRSIENLK